MNTLIVVGHGRLNHSEWVPVPKDVAVWFYAPPGFGVDQKLARAAAAGQLTPFQTFGERDLLPTHYISPSTTPEVASRWSAVKLRQAKVNSWVATVGGADTGNKLSVTMQTLIDHFRVTKGHPGPLLVHWCLCRSEVGELGGKASLQPNKEFKIEVYGEMSKGSDGLEKKPVEVPILTTKPSDLDSIIHIKTVTECASLVDPNDLRAGLKIDDYAAKMAAMARRTALRKAKEAQAAGTPTG